MTKEIDVRLPDGSNLHAYDTVDELGAGFPVFWFHGTPNIGTPPAPLFAAAARLGLRWVSYDRPGYAGSTRRLGRDAASAANDVAAVADALGLDRFAVVSHSGGGPPALACAALLPERVVAGVVISGLAPFGTEDFDWFADMSASGVSTLTAASQGVAALEAQMASDEESESPFSPSDLAAFDGDWGWFGSVVGPALATGHDGHVDDEISYVNPWGFEVASIAAPILVVHGDQDLLVPASHGRWLGQHVPGAELRLSPGDGHISVLDSGASAALDWLSGQISATR